MTDIGVLTGYTSSSPAGVSADGKQFAGTYNSHIGYDRARSVVWSDTGELHLPGLLPGGNFAWGTDISADGRVVVGYGGYTNGARAWTWSESSGLQTLSASENPDASTYAAAITQDASTIGGYYTGVSARVRPMIWRGSQSINLDDLGLGGRIESCSFDNRMFGIVGTQPAVWSTHGVLSVLTMPENIRLAHAHDGAGEIVVGTGIDYQNHRHGLVWVGGQLMLLNDFASMHGVLMPGWNLNSVSKISADGRRLFGHGTRMLTGDLQRTEAFMIEIPSPSAFCIALTIFGIGRPRSRSRSG